MICDFDNKVIEDILLESIGDRKSNKYICTDKTLGTNEKVKKLPLIVETENIYTGLERKIVHYFKNIDKYKAIGIDNVEQFIYLFLLKYKRLHKDKVKDATTIKKYLESRDDYIKIGILNIDEFSKYKKLMAKGKSYSEAGKLIFLEKNFKENEEELKTRGIFSFRDYIKYDEMMKEAIDVFYLSKINSHLKIQDFLNFELREFRWKRQYYLDNQSLKNVQKYIDNLYRTSKETLNLPGYYYFEEPSYHYMKNGSLNFTQHFKRNANLIKLRHKYKSEKKEENYYEYLLNNIKEE